MHAAAAVAAARAAGMRFAFVTNNASRTPEVVAERLTGMGMPAEPHDVVTSAQAAGRTLAAQLPGGAAVLVVGTDALAAEVILSRAGVVRTIKSTRVTRTGTWVLAALFGLGAIMNALSRSEGERLVAPVVLLLSLLCLVVARSKPGAIADPS